MEFKICMFFNLFLIFKINNSIVKNKKWNIFISNNKSLLDVTLQSENRKKININLYEGGVNYLNKKLFNCDDKLNKCKNDNFSCKMGIPKKARFKFYEDQIEFYEIKFCYIIHNNSNINMINFNNLLEILKNKLKKFDLKYELEYSNSKLKRDHNNKFKQVIYNYSYIKLTINPKLPNYNRIIHYKNMSLWLDIINNNKYLIKDLEFKKIDYIINIFSTCDFRIESNNSRLMWLKNELEKNINNNSKGELLIKSKSNAKNKFNDFKMKLKNIYEYKYNRITKINIHFKKNLKENSIYLGFNYIKKNLDLIVTYEKNKTPIIKVYKKSILSKIILITLVVIFSVVAIIVICFIVIKSRNKKDINKTNLF